MRIGELAAQGGVGVETVRYYQRIGLLRTPDKPYGGTRRYTEHDLARLRFIRRAQELGFSLGDIASLLRLSSADCEDVQALASRKLELVHGKLADLRRIEAALAETLGRCRSRRPSAPCPIIQTLTGR